MELFWREHRLGQRLIVITDDGKEEEAGAVRQTPRGYDAMARALGYDPGRAQKEIPTLEEAKAFVESFRAWELFTGSVGLEVEPGVRPLE